MILSGHASNYLPGIQLLNKLALSDKFMYCDHLKHSRKSWHVRNQLRGEWLTVPIKSKFGTPVGITEIDGDDWRRDHLKTIRRLFRQTKFFDRYYPDLERFYSKEWRFLGEMNQCLMDKLIYWLDIQTPIYDSIDADWVGLYEDPIEMIICMCRETGTNAYLSNQGARAYIGTPEEARMHRSGINHLWQSEVTGPNILELLFDHGPLAGDIVKNSGYIINEEEAAYGSCGC